MVWIEVWDNRMRSWDRYYFPSTVEARRKALLLLKGEYGKQHSEIKFYKNKNSRNSCGSVKSYGRSNLYIWSVYNNRIGVMDCIGIKDNGKLW